MKLLLVRHGETEANLLGVLQGHTPVPLGDRGIEQAKKLGERLREVRIDAAYSSDLPRAAQTAEEIVKFHNLKVMYTPQLRERSYGVFQGRPVTEYELAFSRSGLPRDAFRPEGGENYEDVVVRVKQFFAGVLLEHPEETVLFVAHSGTNRVLLRFLLRRPDAELLSIAQDNTCLNEIEISATGKVTELRLNCTAHLPAGMFQPFGMQE